MQMDSKAPGGLFLSALSGKGGDYKFDQSQLNTFNGSEGRFPAEEEEDNSFLYHLHDSVSVL